MKLFQTVIIKKYGRIGYISAIIKGTNNTTNQTMYCVSEFDEENVAKRKEASQQDRLFRWRKDELTPLTNEDVLSYALKCRKALTALDSEMGKVLGPMEYAFGNYSGLHMLVHTSLQHMKA